MSLAQAPGVLEARQYIFTRNLRVAGEDIVDRIAGAKIAQNRLHRDPRAANHRSTIADFGVQLDAFHAGTTGPIVPPWQAHGVTLKRYTVELFENG